MSLPIQIFVPGKPVPKGSQHRSFHGRVVDTTKGLGVWQRALHAQLAVVRPPEPLKLPITLTCIFHLQPPQKRPNRPPWPVVPPDFDKLVRAVADACSQVIFHDDAWVVESHIYKRYSLTPGVAITIAECREGGYEGWGRSW